MINLGSVKLLGGAVRAAWPRAPVQAGPTPPCGPAHRRYHQAAAAEEHDRSSLGLPIPLIIFGLSTGGHNLAIRFLEHIMAGRRELSAAHGVYFPVLGLAGAIC